MAEGHDGRRCGGRVPSILSMLSNKEIDSAFIRRTIFKALSNFKIDISSEVKGAGPLSGYTCTVTLFDGTDLG